MKIKVSEIPEDGRDVEFVRRLNSLGADASIHMSLKRVGVEVLVTGKVDAEVELECGRCLGVFTLDLSVPVELACSVEAPQEDDETELAEEDMLRYFMDNEIDLGLIAQEQALLNMPMRALCSDECKGLCPTCGIDLNKGECNCPDVSGDPRLQILRKLLNKGEKE